MSGQGIFRRVWCLGVLVLTGAVAGTAGAEWVAPGKTYWQGPVGVAGDWWDSANWSAGVPRFGETVRDRAFIQNGGIAQISGGEAGAVDLTLGQGDAQDSWGGLRVSGGDVRVTQGVTVSGHSAIEIEGGVLSSDRIEVGHWHGDGARITQSGGRNTVADSLTLGGLHGVLYNDLPVWQVLPVEATAGVYELSGGELRTRSTVVGEGGRGEFHQSGGVHEVAQTLMIGGEREYVPYSVTPDGAVRGPRVPRGDLALAAVWTDAAPSSWFRVAAAKTGIYGLASGELRASEVEVRFNGTLTQTGGEMGAGFVSVDEGGRYALFGGEAEITGGLRLGVDGTLDFGGGGGTLRSANGLIDLGQGTMLGARHASLELGEGSLLIVPQRVNLRKMFGDIETAGLVHTLGTDLVLKRGSDYSGWWGTLEDHVRVGGKLVAAEDGALNLLGGLAVEKGGVVDLKGGTLRVTDKRSGIADGELRAANMTVDRQVRPRPMTAQGWAVGYGQGSGKFSQHSGEVKVGDWLQVAEGAYELEGGTLTANSLVVGKERSFGLVGSRRPEGAEFAQRAGRVVADSLRVGYWMPPDVFTAHLGMFVLESERWRPSPRNRVEPAVAEYRMQGGEICAGSIGVNDGGVLSIEGGEVSAGSIGIYAGGVFSVDGSRVEVSDGVWVREGGNLNIHAGRLVIEETLRVGGPVGYLLASSPTVSDSTGEAATLAIGSQADIHARYWQLTRGSRVEAEPGSIVHLTGPTGLLDPHRAGESGLDIRPRDAQALAGLENVTLVLTGGDAVVPLTLEAAGLDLGSEEGFEGNFGLAGLVLGEGDAPAYVRLQNYYLNSAHHDDDDITSPWPVEAVYVDHLVVNSGSVLDLNRLHLYYRTAEIAPGALIIAGPWEMAVIPEPGAVGLLGAGALLLGRRRRGSA